MKSPHLDSEWLRERYLTDGLSTYDIGKLVGRDPKRIYEKLREFEIPTRPRGMNLKGEDNFMRTAKANPFLGKSHSSETRAILSAKASAPRPHLRGKRNGMSGRCGTLNPRYVDGSAPERQTVYASAKWKAVLRAVVKRDGGKCRRCSGVKRGHRGMHAHHVRPWAGNKTLRFSISNIVTLCRTCHEWVHSRENADGEFMD